MKHTSMTQRPFGRIDHIMARFKKIWHYYPEHSLIALLLETTIYANAVNSGLPPASMDDIEDIAYPEGHLLHGSRHLEMGIDAIEKQYESDSLPPVPLQTALTAKVADHWCKHPQMRLGQILFNARLMETLEKESFANDS